jgi:hypothetical protein
MVAGEAAEHTSKLAVEVASKHWFSTAISRGYFNSFNKSGAESAEDDTV